MQQIKKALLLDPFRGRGCRGTPRRHNSRVTRPRSKVWTRGKKWT